jgi:hypothetical protein
MYRPDVAGGGRDSLPRSRFADAAADLVNVKPRLPVRTVDAVVSSSPASVRS